jgi:beta-galactosidase
MGTSCCRTALTQTGYTDGYGLNRYFQWYYGTSETQLGQNLDDIHAANPTQMIGVSEYGAGNALTHHTDNVYGGRVCSRDTSGFTRICYQPEGYANYVHEKAYAQIVARPYLMGSWIWNMFDFGSGNRHEGDIGQTNTKGIVTFGRDVKKDVFYFYKANWTNTPVTYITGRRYTERAYTLADVKVYSNADSVVLQGQRCRGRHEGRGRVPAARLRVHEGAAEAGSNSVVATGSHGGTQVSDAVNWNLPAENATNVFIAAGQLTTGFQSNDPLLGQHRYGSDNFFLGGDLPAIVGRSAVGLSGAVAINGLGSTAIPETGRVWDMWREGPAFSYRVPVANGTYQVTLGFLEPSVTARAPVCSTFRQTAQPRYPIWTSSRQPVGATRPSRARSRSRSPTVNCSWTSRAWRARPSCPTSRSSSNKTAGRRSSTEVSLRRRGARTTQ